MKVTCCLPIGTTSANRPAALLVVLSLLLDGCASRHARIVEVQQPHDATMNCLQLRSEISATNRMLLTYGVDRSQQSDRNQLAILGAFLNPMILIQVDGGDAADREVNAYSMRNSHLQRLSTKKGCTND